MGFFAGRTLYFATMHAKEKIVSGIMEEAFGLSVKVAPIDTDALGTFSGETERPADALSTARMKIEHARQVVDGDLFLASEGSFGPHPAYGIIPCNEEWLVLTDTRHSFEICVHGLHLETNFGQRRVTDETALLEFADSSGFPQHGLLLRGGEGKTAEFRKGLQQRSALLSAFRDLQERFEVITVETDMRAMMNPTRQQNIYKTALDLISRMKSYCPSCGIPGWAISSYQSGLPCGWCSLPTRSSLFATYACVSCAHTQQKKFPHQKETEDPMYCDHCNP